MSAVMVGLFGGVGFLLSAKAWEEKRTTNRKEEIFITTPSRKSVENPR
jgi:hypothetical protein